MVLASPQAVVTLVEFIIIVIQITQGYHTFTFILIDFHIQAELRHTADSSFKHLPQLVAHEFHLLILDTGTLGTGCQLLHRAAMFTQLFILVLAGTAPSVSIPRQQPMHHHVRITADRGSKMRIVIKSQPVMPDIMRTITCLHHGPQRNGFYQILLFLPLNVGQ